MNWSAITAVSTFGLFVVGVIGLVKPNVDKNILNIIYSIVTIFLLLVLYHKFFRLIRKKEKDAIYLVKWGIKHWIENPATFKKLGYTSEDIESINDFEFGLYPLGKSIKLSRRYRK